MFQNYELIIELNKIQQRFKGHPTKIGALITTVNEVKNENAKAIICSVLQAYYPIIKAFDSIFCDDDLDFMTNDLDLFYIEDIIKRVHTYLLVYGINFFNLYQENYNNENTKTVKRVWDNLYEEQDIVEFKKSFLELFDEFHNVTINKYPDNFTMQLKDVHNLYRARSWNVNEDYELMIPKDEFAGNNRWNPPDVAYLYLSFSNIDESFDGTVTVGEKTCFEEIRLKLDSDVAICRFKPINRRGRILNMCFDNEDLKQAQIEYETYPTTLKKVVLDDIASNKKLNQKLMAAAKAKSKAEFYDYYKKRVNLNKYVNVNKVAALFLGKNLLSHIGSAIFEPVDEVTDPDLIAYQPFRIFSEYLISKGYIGVAYPSTRMKLIGCKGTCLVLFNKLDATYDEGTMKIYKYQDSKYLRIN